MVSLSVELYAFLLIMLTGMAVGFLFDLQRIWRRVARPGRLAVKLADAAFVIVGGAAVTISFFYISWGDLRFYLLLGLLAGAVAYFHLASPGVTRLVEACLRVAVRLILRVLATGRAAGGGLYRRVGHPAARAVAPLRRLARRVRWVTKNLPRRVVTLWRKLPGFLA